MKKSMSVLFVLLLAVGGTAVFSSCWTFVASPLPRASTPKDTAAVATPESAPKAPAVAAVPEIASEADFEVTTADGQVTITKYKGKAAALIIPATIGGLPVVEIGYSAFARDNITSVSIPASVTSIAITAFFSGRGYYTNGPERWVTSGPAAITVDPLNPSYSSRDGVLFSKTGDKLIRCPVGKKGQYAIPAGVTSIGNGAFYGCTGLASITIPPGVTSIGNEAFRGCTGLTSISISASVTSIGDDAFATCWQLTAIQVNANNTVFSSRDGVLFDKREKELITCPVGKKGQYAIPAGVTSISNRAFSSSDLTSVSIPAGVTRIGDSAFYDCSLTSISIPASVTGIGDSAFYGSGLTSITIPESVTSIGDSAFYGCGNLKSIHIPARVTSIGDGAFGGSQYAADGVVHSGLEAITVDPRNASYSSRDGVLFNKTATVLVCYPANRKETLYTIPDGVTGIGASAFGCINDLRAVSIPASVTSIANNAFEGCSSLSVVTVHAVRPPKITDNGDFLYYLDGVPLYVPAASLAAYRGADEWKDCKKLLPETPLHARQMSAGFAVHDGVLIGYSGSAATPLIPADWGVTSIGEEAFKGCTSLTSINIPVGVTKIDDDAFSDCTGLTSVSIPEGVTTIEYSAFSGCTGLSSIRIPASVTSIGNYVFSGCISLTSIPVDANNKNYVSRDGVLFNKSGDTLLAYPAGLKARQYTIPAGVTEIESGAFWGSNDLTSVNIPAGVTSIDAHTFRNCTGLTSVSIPASVTSIDMYAFVGCTGLTSITIGTNVSLRTSYGDADAFENKFVTYYNTNGKKAGMYTWNGTAWSFAAR
ncbi:hypothetical protein FACS1894147_07900 [Spirochaetia bacterium]|nr:hypothetical protein FACS1894147_07900 [Spirochaetia bacterium]